MTIAKFVDAENGMEAEVMQFGAAKFHVVLRDIDAGEVAGVRIYSELGGAMAYARSLVNVEVA